MTYIIHSQLRGYRVEEKLHLGVWELKKVEYHWPRQCMILDFS
jgi:hypothetical protein